MFLATAAFWYEAMWLSALAVVPLVFNFRSLTPSFDETKTYALHFFALVTLTLLAWDMAQAFAAARRRGEKIESLDVMAWLRRDTVRLLFAAVAVFIFVYAVSTALSPLPYFSLWGVTPASSGYNLYSFLSMMVIFFAVATRLRSVDQVWRALYVIAGVGALASLYGTAQHFGWDGIGRQGNVARVYSTFGNPIYFGAYLVMSIPVTVAVIARHGQTGKKWWLALPVIALGLQLAAMWFTGSRGPLVGLGAALGVTGVVLLTLRPLRESIVTAAASAAGLAIAAGLIFAPGGLDSSRAVQFEGELSQLSDRSGAGSIQAGLGGRGEIWGETMDLAFGWDRLPPDTGVSRALRPLFGFGPDMLRYSTSLVAGPRSSLEIVDHTHNRPLQVLMEQGWVGFIAFGTVAGVTLLLVFKIWRSLRQDPAPGMMTTLAFVAITGGLAGVAVEQVTGVGRVSDLLTSWVLIGLLAVVYRLVSRRSETLEAPAQEHEAQSRASSRRSRRARGRSDAAPAQGQASSAAAFALAVGIGVLSVVMFILMDAQMFRASRTAMTAAGLTGANDAYQKYQEARSTAPQVEVFTVLSIDLLYDNAKDLLATGDREGAADLAEEAYRQLLQYHSRNPLAIHTRLGLAETAALLLEIGVVDYRDEMVARYEDIARQFPNEAGVMAVVANSYVAAEEYEKGIEYADRAIAIEVVTRPIPQAWWVKGEALVRLERIDEGVAAFETAISKEPKTEFTSLAHRSLAKVLEDRGDTAGAASHRAAADAVDAELAAAAQSR